MSIQNSLDTTATVKRWWLIFIIISTVYAIVSGIYNNLATMNLKWPLLIPMVFLPNIIFFAAEYYCAYRKSGTKFLTTMIVLRIFGIVLSLGLYDSPLLETKFSMNEIIFSTVLNIILIILSLKLRKINLSAQKAVIFT